MLITVLIFILIFNLCKTITGEGASSPTRHPGEEPQAAVDRRDEEEEGGEEAVGGGRGAHQDPGGDGGGEGQTDQQVLHLKYIIIISTTTPYLGCTSTLGDKASEVLPP